MNNNTQKYNTLRSTHQCFYFHSTSCQWHSATELHISYHFSIDDTHHFYPSQLIQLPTQYAQAIHLSEQAIHTLAFQLGMVELISYWKAACPQQLVIKEYALSDPQKEWWKKLYFQGLGEFFYTNGIAASMDNFMHISCAATQPWPQLPTTAYNSSRVIVPVGGGKDSIVSLELLKTLPQHTVVPLIVNPRPASLHSVANAGLDMQQGIIIKRSIHPHLLQLNKEGYLNGHTPFSAMLAFACLLAAQLIQAPYIALSNESSANEATVPGTNINHQYSKSYEFEADFRQYYQSYLNSSSAYFSFLRPISELQIAALFSQYNWQHAHFRSCNVGSKTDSWCCHCPKCLFTYLMLSPFLPKSSADSIFGKALLNEETMRHHLNELRGLADIKPFECVGTVEEVNTALAHAHSSYKHELLMPQQIRHSSLQAALDTWNTQHALPQQFEQLLRQALKTYQQQN